MKVLKIKNKKGVTLIELLITIVILSILFFIGYPMYKSYVEDSYAEQAKQQMLTISNDLDKIKGKFYTFEAALDSNGKIYPDIAIFYTPTNSPTNKRFLLSVEDVTPTSYKIIATPTEIQGNHYGKLKLEYKNEELIGLYDENNDNTWNERWY